MKFKAIHYLMAMLKIYNINHIVASPGGQNAYFNILVQQNSFFKPTSVLDERSAAYVALGLSQELNNAVAITCTGATASRNYMSAMTEAYYRHCPLVVITFFNSNSNKFVMAPQYVDRSVSQNDIKYLSINLPAINSQKDVKDCLLFLNIALSMAVNRNLPVHINCPAINNYKEIITELPNDIWKPEFNYKDFSIDQDIFIKKRTAIFIGSHNKFSKSEEKCISDFAVNYDIPVLCDHTSNYHGKNKILVAQVSSLLRLPKLPELILDIGYLSGEYTAEEIFKGAEIWRISENIAMECRYNMPIKKYYNCSEAEFFGNISLSKSNINGYYKFLKNIVDNIFIPELPLCYSYICSKLSAKLPQNSSLHLAILNSLRNMNCFDLDNSIDVSCNVGGFGIDGPISTMVGMSLANPNKKIFGLTGDLAFFYDMNILGQRNISNNIRIIIVNNNGGLEFRLSRLLESKLHDDIGILVAASNHYKNGARAWVESCGFEYMQANDKSDFDSKIDDFCNKEFNKPVIFEVFTNVPEELKGFRILKNANRNLIQERIIDCYKYLTN